MARASTERRIYRAERTNLCMDGSGGSSRECLKLIAEYMNGSMEAGGHAGEQMLVGVAGCLAASGA